MTSQARDEALLIRSAAAGDERAFEALVAQHQAAVLAVARAHIGDPAAAEEIAQEVFVRLFRHLSRFRGDSALRTWLIRITLNRCTDAFRRELRRREEPMPLSERPSDLEGPERLQIRADEMQRIRAAVARLPGHLRSVVTLRYDAELSYAEIGSLLGVPAGTVGSRLAAALQMLRGDLAR